MIAPALLEVPLPERQEVADLINALCSGRIELFVFLTGVGARAVLSAADAIGKKEDVIQALTEMKVVCRGPKPVAVMRANKVPIDLVAPEPHTSEVLMNSIKAQSWDLRGKTIALQHYGEINTYLRDRLADMGAEIVEISLYKWELPNDIGPIENAVRSMVQRQADAVLFTSKVQIRHLFLVAERLGLKDSLKKALSSTMVVGTVGPVCVQALAKEGIAPHVTPIHPKMGPLVLALAEYFESNGQSHPTLPSPQI